MWGKKVEMPCGSPVNKLKDKIIQAHYVNNCQSLKTVCNYGAACTYFYRRHCSLGCPIRIYLTISILEFTLSLFIPSVSYLEYCFNLSSLYIKNKLKTPYYFKECILMILALRYHCGNHQSCKWYADHYRTYAVALQNCFFFNIFTIEHS